MNDNRHLVRAALVSGEFKQGRYSLEPESNTFCCLGVACVVAERHGVEVLRGSDGRLLGASLFGLQRAVGKWLDIADAEDRRRAKWNDCEGLTFAQIAERF